MRAAAAVAVVIAAFAIALVHPWVGGVAAVAGLAAVIAAPSAARVVFALAAAAVLVWAAYVFYGLYTG